MAKKTRRKEKASNKKSTQQKENANSFLSKTPTWRFMSSDVEHDKWSLHNNCSSTFELINNLKKFEGMTWSDIMVKGKKQNHHIEVASCIKEAQTRLNNLNIYEDQLFSLRLTGTTRIYGILKDGVFSILWYDCNHEICPSNLKHT